MNLEDLVKNNLYMNWLRPEGVAWDVTAAHLLRKWLGETSLKVDFGSGNGYTTFLASGGKFKPEYDWYFNVNVEGFEAGNDIYNTFNVQNIQTYVESKPEFRWSLAIDHKKALLEQAMQIGLYDSTLIHDGNKPLVQPNIKLEFIFSNILYWLNDPIQVLKNLYEILAPKGLIVIAFPNSRFYESATSYKWKERQSELLRMINRGRADSIMWSMDYSDFQIKLKDNDVRLEIIDFSTYLSPSLLQVWDLGLRPLSPALITHVNGLSQESRLAFKKDWCNSIEKIIIEQTKEEISEVGSAKNGFNFAVLRKE